MATYRKIATCTYCGTRAALVLRGSERHELACATCGAPLHDMKAIKLPPEEARPHRPDYGISHRPPPKSHRKTKTRKPKKRRSGFKRFLEEAFDVLEDIFD